MDIAPTNTSTFSFHFTWNSIPHDPRNQWFETRYQTFAEPTEQKKIFLHLGKFQDFDHLLSKACCTNFVHCYYTSENLASRQHRKDLENTFDGFLEVDMCTEECFIIRQPYPAATAVIRKNGDMFCVGRDSLSAAFIYYSILKAWGCVDNIFYPYWFDKNGKIVAVQNEMD